MRIVGELSGKEKLMLKDTIESEGLRAHARGSSCLEGCSQCAKFRQIIGWPPGIPLERNLAQLGTSVLEAICRHYAIDIAAEGRCRFKKRKNTS